MDQRPSSPGSFYKNFFEESSEEEESENVEESFGILLEDITSMRDSLRRVSHEYLDKFSEIQSKFAALQKEQAKLIAKLKKEEENLKRLDILVFFLTKHPEKFLKKSILSPK